MKEYTAKTVEEAVKLAAEELGVDEDRLIYEVKEEKKSLFRKAATIAVYGDEDAASYAETYLHDSLAALGIEITTESVIEDSIIKVTIDSERNPVLIGRGGKTLQALNELTKLAVSNKFKRRYRIWFASMPLPLMALVCVLAVFIICQFITADLQSFIYFQF